MKVAVTFDLSDDELFALNLMHNGRLEKPMRKEAREAIEEMVQAQLDAAVPVVRDSLDSIKRRVREQLGVAEA